MPFHNIFGKNIPPVSANKSQMGHAMGASSAIEAILAMEGMIKETLLPTINYVPDPEIEIDCVAEGARKLKSGICIEKRVWFRRMQFLSGFAQTDLIECH